MTVYGRSYLGWLLVVETLGQGVARETPSCPPPFQGGGYSQL